MGCAVRVPKHKADRMTDREFDAALDSGLHRCNTCGDLVDWLNEVRDRYGIYYKRACDRCYDRVSAEIAGFEFDPAYAGESL